MKMYSSIINKTINPNFNISFINKNLKQLTILVILKTI